MGMCKRCHGQKHLIVGALLLLNAFVWPQWTGWEGPTSWMSFIGILMILGGFVSLVVPNNCAGCAAACGTMPAVKGKKK